jgi:hypothetical protein
MYHILSPRVFNLRLDGGVSLASNRDMASPLCPVCHNSTPRSLQALNQFAYVNYYYCPVCHHIWTTPKDDAGKVTHITPPPDPEL